MKWGMTAVLLGLAGATAGEIAGSAYFYRRTMMRYNAKRERTIKMSGVEPLFTDEHPGDFLFAISGKSGSR